MLYCQKNSKFEIYIYLKNNKIFIPKFIRGLNGLVSSLDDMGHSNLFLKRAKKNEPKFSHVDSQRKWIVLASLIKWDDPKKSLINGLNQHWFLYLLMYAEDEELPFI